MAEQNDMMAPDASPGALGKSGVRRVNKVPLFIAGGVLVAFAGSVALVAVSKSNQQQAQQEQPERQKKTNTSAKAMAETIAGDNKAGLVASKLTVPDLADLAPPQDKPPIPVAPVSNLDAPPVPPQRPSAPPITAAAPMDPESENFRLDRQKRFVDAARAKTRVPFDKQGAGGSSLVASSAAGATPQTRDEILAKIAETRRQMEGAAQGDVNAKYQAELARIRTTMGLGGASAGAGAGSGSALALASTAQGSRNDIQQFAGNGQGDRWKLDSEVQAPRSKFELRAGGVIPGLMLSGINSDLPGSIVGQVSSNVYDTATGRHLLVPQFSKLFGTYSSQVVYGQKAVLVAWQRIQFPDGKVFDIGAMPGTDSAGYAGFRDQVDNHYGRIFGSALLMSLVTAGVTYSQDQSRPQGLYSQPTASGELQQALGQQLGQVTAQMITKNLNIAPTLEIRPGYRFNIIAVKDLTFTKPYKSFDYQQ